MTARIPIPSPIPGLSGAGDVANGVASWAGGSAADMVLGALGGSFVSAAQAVAALAVDALGQTTSVDLSVDWLRRNVAVMAAVTLPVLVGLFVAQVIGSVIRREPGGLARAVLGVGKATVGAGLALALTQSALVATDQVCAVIAGASGTTVQAAAARFLQLTWLAGGQAGAVLQMLLGLLVIVGAVMLWAVLLFRKVALVVVAVFAPVAFAGSTWDATRAWSRRWVEAVAALVLCKIVIVVVFVVGASAFSGLGPTASTAPASPGPVASGAGPGGAGQALSDLLVGLLLLTMAVASPWATWRFLHWAGLEGAAALTAVVASSPIPGGARAVGQQARFTGQWAVTSAVSSALGLGGSPTARSLGGNRPPPGSAPGAGHSGSPGSPVGPSAPPPSTGSGPAGRSPQPMPHRSPADPHAGPGTWTPPSTTVRGRGTT